MFKIETVNVDAALYLNHPEYRYEYPARAAILHMIASQGKYEYLGSGAFGTVYGSNDSNIVYKFGSYNSNRPYLSFVKELSKMKEHNPFLPRIYGARIYSAGKGHDKQFVVAMERLNSLPWSNSGLDTAMPMICDMIRSDQKMPDFESFGFTLTVSPQLKQAVSVVQSACTAARRGNHSADYDLHNGNFMMRDKNQLVIIDPLA